MGNEIVYIFSYIDHDVDAEIDQANSSKGK